MTLVPALSQNVQVHACLELRPLSEATTHNVQSKLAHVSVIAWCTFVMSSSECTLGARRALAADACLYRCGLMQHGCVFAVLG